MEVHSGGDEEDIVVVMPGGKGDAPSSVMGRKAPAAAKSPTPASKAPSLSRSPPNELEDVLNVSFPRCAVCETGWYDVPSDNDEESETMEMAANGRPCHTNLLPMPPCQCTTRLALPPLPSALFSSQEFADPERILSQINTHAFGHLALCKLCLKKRIDTAGEVLKHDYMQDDVENGQRSVGFSVGLDCTRCHRKFMSRVLERILENEGGLSRANSGSSAGSRNKKGKADANWFEAVEATIQLVGFAKREARRERRRNRHRKLSQGSGDDPREAWWKRHPDAFTGGDDNCASDDCYSFSSDSGDESDRGDERMTKGPRRVELQLGELRQELMEKDSKFRQLVEDEKYVKQMMAEEEQRAAAAGTGSRIFQGDEALVKKMLAEEKAAEEQRKARAREDHELAMKLQEEFDKQNTSKAGPVKTRSKRPRPSILDALQKSAKKAAKKPSRDEKMSPVVDLVDDETDGKPRAELKSPPEASSVASSEMSPDRPEPEPKKPRSRKADVPVDESDESEDEDEDDPVREVMSMGFSRASAERSLKDAKGNVQLAVSMLLSETTDRDG